MPYWKIGNPCEPCCCTTTICGTVIGCGGTHLTGVTITVKSASGLTTIGTGTTDYTGQACITVPDGGTYVVSASSVSGYASTSPQTITVAPCATATASWTPTPTANQDLCIDVFGCGSSIPHNFAGQPDGACYDSSGNVLLPFGTGDCAAFLSGANSSTGVPLPLASISIDGATPVTGSRLCVSVAPGTHTVSVTAPYGYKSITFTITTNGCTPSGMEVYLQVLSTTYQCCGNQVFPKTLTLSDGNTSLVNSGGSFWQWCDGSYPVSNNPQCNPPRPSISGALEAVSGTTVLSFTMGCVLDAYNNWIGMNLTVNWPVLEFIPAADVGPPASHCVYYPVPLACGWNFTDLGFYSGDFCGSCGFSGICNQYAGIEGIVFQVFIPAGSITINPFDLTVTMPGATPGGSCTDGSSPPPNPLTSPVTITG